jgi:hypothetical protein
MKINLLWLSAAMLVLSCGQNDKGNSAEKDSTATTGNTNVAKDELNQISFKADGENVNSEGWVVQRFVENDKATAPWLNITSNMHKDKRCINVNLNGAMPGAYGFDEEGTLATKSHGTYFPDYSDIMNSYSFISGAFTITEVDTVQGLVSGTFEGVVKNSKDGKTISISDGKLNKLRLKSGVTNLAKELEALSK